MKHTEMRRNEDSTARALSVLGERWTLLVVREVLSGTRRFEDILVNLGIARNVLADRLQKLVGEGVLERRPYQDQDTRPRYEYWATQKGLDLAPVIVGLVSWGERYTMGKPGKRQVVLHGDHRAEPRVTCSECGEELTPDHIHLGPKGATRSRTRSTRAAKK